MARKEGLERLTENLKGLENGGDRNKAGARGVSVGIGVCGDENWVGSIVTVIVGYQSFTDAVGSATDIVLQSKNIEKLNKNILAGAIVWGDEAMVCEVEQDDEFGDQKNGAEARKTGLGNKSVRLQYFETSEGSKEVEEKMH